MITNGQARRIAAEWQAPRSSFSTLQHTGEITETLLTEIEAEIRALQPGSFGVETLRDLIALAQFADAHFHGTVPGWGAWSDQPVTTSQLYGSES